MGAVDERLAIGLLFDTAWKAGSNTSLAIPNRNFTKPAELPWVRLSYQTDIATSIEIGKGQHRHPGTVFVQVFTPEDQGDKPALVLADEAALIFRGKQVSSGANGRIIFRTPMIRAIGVTDDGWFQVNVVIPFIRDEFFS